MNIGNNKHYNDMCIAYLQELIDVNQLNPPYVGVNLCHKGLLKKYFPNCSERSLRTSCSSDLKICNNANDENPTWEDVTSGVAHTFTNTVKTADKWALGFKFYGKSYSIGRIYTPTIVDLEEAEV